ncbi:MAG: NADH:ubiquinone reductase (Na(+)-transporting) subunit C [Alphaproteobacteria bacterium]|nr:NADH:ubiquinone reductase (Na(+)-transporting) subunit C [Alphaproteobacteria bacterium]
MAFSNGYILGFAGGVCVFCSVIVASTATMLKDQQDLNRERDLHQSILTALALVEDGQSVPGPEIDRLWAERVELQVFHQDGRLVEGGDASADLDGDGDADLDDVALAQAAAKGSDAPPALVALYKRVDDGGAVGAYALPVQGKGLWGPISGYLALAPDLSEVIGSTFFAPKETPGLGAEIMEPPFEGQWKGKRIFDDGKPRGIRVVKGGALDSLPADAVAYAVDGVSGATITSRGVDAMVVSGIERDYAPTLLRLRSR